MGRIRFSERAAFREEFANVVKFFVSRPLPACAMRILAASPALRGGSFQEIRKRRLA